jgi:hypothetical protein
VGGSTPCATFAEEIPMTERFRTIVDVHVLLVRPDGAVLLMERANTGYADGQAGATPPDPFAGPAAAVRH